MVYFGTMSTRAQSSAMLHEALESGSGSGSDDDDDVDDVDVADLELRNELRRAID